MHRSMFLILVGAALLVGCALAHAQDSPATDEQTLKDAGLSVDTPTLLDFFRKRTLTDAGLARMQALIRQLGDRAYKVRARASADLKSLGSVAVPYLRQAEHDPDPELARRAGECLKQITDQESRVGLPEAAARLLAKQKPVGAAEVLLAYAPFAPDEIVANEIQTTLAAVAVRAGKPDKVLIDGLTDSLPARRAVAVEALCKAGLARSVPQLRERLGDADVAVRLSAARALATAQEPVAIPVLIDLLTQLPAARAWQAEDLLLRLADTQAPAVPLGRDDLSRSKCRAAWAAWWKDNAVRADLSRIEGADRPLGYTLIVMINAGEVIELDAHDRKRYGVSGLVLPLDAQMLPGDRLLVAEHDGNRVSEWNRKGELVWEYKVETPLMAQRLTNGNTFIASTYRLLEVDRQGKEIFNYSRPGGEPFMKALKLPNGEIAFITSTIRLPRSGRFIRLDPGGKELQNIPAEVATSGGRIDVLPDGRVLIPERANNRVAEYDAEGRLLWQADFPEPVAAARLRNGHTLVTAYNQTRAVELDRNGKQVWEYHANTRVTRAFRR
jgi:HEAT repeat protein